MIQLVETIINRIGYTGVALLVFLENVFPPIPSEAVIPFAGFAAKRGELNFVGVVIAGTIGSTLGALPLYYLGRYLSEARIRAFFADYGNYVGIQPNDIDRAHEWLENHGNLAVFICRLIPGLRSVISISAGIVGMNLAPFLLWTTIGTGAWTLLLTAIGFSLGANYAAIQPYMDIIGWIVFLSIAGYLAFRAIRRRAESP